MRKRLSTLLASAPGLAFASDPTPLVKIFIAWPLLTMALVCFGLVLIRARNAFSINLGLLLILALVIWWADDVGYLNKPDGRWFWGAILINLVAIATWWYRTLTDKQE